jgi:hypothetical protein
MPLWGNEGMIHHIQYQAQGLKVEKRWGNLIPALQQLQFSNFTPLILQLVYITAPPTFFDTGMKYKLL